MRSIAANVRLARFRSKVQQDRERLEELSRFVEGSLHAERALREDRATKELEDITDELEAVFVAECHAEDIFQVEKDFPRVQRYALFVSMMGMLEANIVGLCRAAHRIIPIPEDFNDRKPKVVTRGVTYLESKAGIDTSRFLYYIKLAKQLNSLRNCITHAEGSLKERGDAESITKFIRDIPTVKIDNRDRLVLLEGFVENTTHEMHTFLDRLHDALSKAWKAQQDTSTPTNKPAAGGSI